MFGAQTSITLRFASAIAIAFIFNASAHALPNLVGHWQLEETSIGQPAVDSSSTNPSGTYGAGATPNVLGPSGFGSAASFGQQAGTDINIGSGTTLNLQNDFSVSAWINLGNTSGKHSIIGNGSWAFRSTGTALQITTFGVKDYTGTAGTLTAGGWTHVAVALDANNDAQFYVNGVDAGFSTHTAQANSNTGDFAIGGRTVGSNFEAFFGALDDVRVYDGVLTQADVQAIMVDFTAPALPTGGKLITPTSATINVGSTFFAVGNLVNDSGLSGPADINNFESITHAGSSGANAWVTDAAFPDYYSGGLPPPVITFALDDVETLTELVTWNYSVPGNAAREITVEFSTTGVNGVFGDAVTLEIPQAFSIASVLPLGGEYLANAVRITFDSNWTGFGAGGDRVGLGEVKFLSRPAPTVPEPATLSLLALAGLGMFGRRRRVA